jgi:hypothetical protein
MVQAGLRVRVQASKKLYWMRTIIDYLIIGKGYTNVAFNVLINARKQKIS